MVDYIPQTIAAPEPQGVCLSSSQSSRHATVVGVLELVVAAAGLARFDPSHPASAYGLTFPTKRYFARAKVYGHLSSSHSASRYFSQPCCNYPRHHSYPRCRLLRRVSNCGNAGQNTTENEQTYSKRVAFKSQSHRIALLLSICSLTSAVKPVRCASTNHRAAS